MLILLSIIAFYSCTSTKSLNNDDQWSLDLKKGGCLDVCKAYSISIKNNGEYDYTGKFKVKHHGKKKGRIKEQELRELKNLLKNITWKDLKSAYDNPALDSQKNTVKYTSESISKKITYSRLEPQELRTLENFINTIIEQDDF